MAHVGTGSHIRLTLVQAGKTLVFPHLYEPSYHSGAPEAELSKFTDALGVDKGNRQMR